MEKNIYQKFCGNINYNTYTDIQNTLLTSTIGLTVANVLIPQCPLIYNSYCFLSIAYLGMLWTNGKVYTKDVNQIRELYSYFINNYNKLNKIFDLNNPVEIYAMFNYLLYKGYLSKNKEFQFSGKETRDLKGLGGVDVITGKAVCRNISGMLTDIINGYGIESSLLGIHSKDYIVNINVLEEQKYTKEELINWVKSHITHEQTYESLIFLIDELVDKRNKNIEFIEELDDGKNILKRKFANHSICYAYKDGKSYFLDPTQTRIYRMNENNKNILYDSECDDIPISLISSIVLNGSKNYLKMKKNLSNPYLSITKLEEETFIKETLDKCKNNMDIFEQFYNDNCELYDDISNKVLKIKKPLYRKIL